MGLTIFSTKANYSDNQEPSFLEDLEREMRQSDFTQTILPNNFSYLAQLLTYGSKTEQPHAFAQSSLRLFGNLLKASPYVNAHALEQLLSDLPNTLVPLMTPYRSKENTKDFNSIEPNYYLQRHFSVILYDNFMTNYTAFKQDPEEFLDKLATDIFKAAQEEMSIIHLRSNLVRFLDTAICKLAWHPEDETRCWDSVKSIACNLSSLYEYSIIDNIEDLDDLFWSLIHRFCFFMDIANTDLSLKFYEKVKEEATLQHIPFLELEEQTSFLESKRACLMRSVLTGEALKRTQQ